MEWDIETGSLLERKFIVEESFVGVNKFSRISDSIINDAIYFGCMNSTLEIKMISFFLQAPRML